MDAWPLVGSILVIVLLAAVSIVILSLAISLSISVLRVPFKKTKSEGPDEDVEEYDPFTDVLPSKDDPRG